MSLGNLDQRARKSLALLPTPVEYMPNLSAAIGRAELYIKRDDYTGLGMGGNKVRQLEFYLGEAGVINADTILITGATQSNFARLAAAAARKCGLNCHIQIEQRVPNNSPAYHRSGNILLSKILGATLHSFPQGENEQGADDNLEKIASKLRSEGNNPYVIHLSHQHPPLGALGYVVAARELLAQLGEAKLPIDEIVVASGSGATHAGLLFGLRALGSSIRVLGICVRRQKHQQHSRISSHSQGISDLLGVDNPVVDQDIILDDDVLAPGYGKINPAILDALKMTARREGIILDPVYTGRAMAGFLNRARNVSGNQKLLFIHTGGQPALFGYEDDLQSLLGENL